MGMAVEGIMQTTVTMAAITVGAVIGIMVNGSLSVWVRPLLAQRSRAVTVGIAANSEIAVVQRCPIRASGRGYLLCRSG